MLRAIYRIDPREEGPAHARAIVDRELGAHVSLPVLEQLELMVSELVTGGLVMGAAGAEAITLDLRVDGAVRCRVTTAGPTDDGSARQQGRALSTVAYLAPRWGLSRARTVTSVWFETGTR